VETDEIDMTAFALHGIQKRRHPRQVPDDGGTSQPDALVLPRVDLFHVQLCGIVRVHVGLRRYVGFVERHEGLRFALVHLGEALTP
jgi:hypothetical protein